MSDFKAKMHQIRFRLTPLGELTALPQIGGVASSFYGGDHRPWLQFVNCFYSFNEWVNEWMNENILSNKNMYIKCISDVCSCHKIRIEDPVTVPALHAYLM